MEASDDEGEDGSGELVADPDCTNRVYGSRPSALLANVAVITGLLAAFCMPVIGAIVDYTPHRKWLGGGSAAVIVLIQGIQVYTTSDTWFIMAILQAVVGFIFQVQVLATLAYFPEIYRRVGETVMNGFTQWFVFIFFGAQLIYLISIIISTTIFELDSVQTGRLAQAVCTIILLLSWSTTWGHFMSPVSERQKVPPNGTSLLSVGFVQNWNTCKRIRKYYPSSLQWFMITVALSDGAITAILPVTVTFMTEGLGLSGGEVGLVFLVALVAGLPGTWLASKITSRLDPRKSLMYNQIIMSLIALVGAMMIRPGMVELAYVWGGLWGVSIGWYEATVSLAFSACQPPGQDAEMTGFYLYASLILSWLPPLIFSLLIEAGVEQHWGLLSLTALSVPAVFSIWKMADWPDVLVEVNQPIPMDGVWQSKSGGDNGDNHSDDDFDSEGLEQLPA